MKSKIFVYGTLMKNMRNHYYLEDSTYMGETEISGYEMYDLGYYPGIVKGNGIIKGEVYEVTEDVMKKIDILENEGNLYLKKEENTLFGKVYIYVYNKTLYNMKKIPYEMQPYNKLMYYVAYGSNMLNERFMNYIKGGLCRFNGKYYNSCKNISEPLKSIKVNIPYDMYFSKNSSKWNESPVCFLDDSKSGFVYGKGYLITKEQFDDIQKQEGIYWYGKIINLGEIDGFQAYTFTNDKNLSHKGYESISKEYLKVLKLGLKETYNELTDEEIEKYIINCTK